MSQESTPLKRLIEKLVTYSLPSEINAELTYLKSKLDTDEYSPFVLASHLSGFLHNLYLTLGSSAAFIEPLIMEAQAILLKLKEPEKIKNIIIPSTTNTLPQIAPLTLTRSEKNKAHTHLLLNTQKRLSNNPKFKKFLRTIWQYAVDHNKVSKKIFMSYAWPIQNKGQENYGEKWTKAFIKRLSIHLCEAGFQLYLDEFHSGGGYPLRKFMQNIANMDYVLVINTQTMSYKLSLDMSGVKYEAVQIKKHLNSKNDDFIINVLLDTQLHSDPDFQHYPQCPFLDDDEEIKYYKALGHLIGQLYGFEKEELEQFNQFYEKTYKAYKIDAELWHVSLPSPFQVKRSDLTENIKDISAPLKVLYGPTGTGKSELVRQYIWENYAGYQTVYWFNASSLEKLKEDFMRLMNTKNNAIEDFSFSIFIAWAVGQKNSLIILDDWQITGKESEEQLNLCALSENSQIIMTTSQSELNFTALYIEVSEYTEGEARTYIKMTLGEQKPQEIDLLLNMIGKKPYQLACACGHIQRESKNLLKFIKYYEKLGDNLFARPLFSLPSYVQSVQPHITHQPTEKTKIIIETQENLSEIAQAIQHFLNNLYDCFKAIDYQNHPVLSVILFPETFNATDEKCIKSLNFIISHLRTLVPQFNTLNLKLLIQEGEAILKKYPYLLQQPLSKNEAIIIDTEKSPIVTELKDDLESEKERFDEQDKLDKLTNNERSVYENAFKLFLQDIWCYALDKQCCSKKIYFFCAFPEEDNDNRNWLYAYVENLKKHLSQAGFTVYPEDITQSAQSSEDLLNEMDHIITLSTPMMKEKVETNDSIEFQFNEKIKTIAKTKSERFVLPILTNKVNYLPKEWRELAEFSFFKNSYLDEFRNLVRTLYGLDQTGGFNEFYKQQLLYQRIRSNHWGYIPQKAECFIGRETQLEDISKKFQQDGQQVLVVTAAGMGGVGKTQLVLQYIYRQGHKYQKIYWIDASSEDSIKAAYAALADELKIPFTEEESKSIDKKAERFKKVLEQKRNWLIIYDNAPDEKTIENLKPVQGGKILITSRHTAWNNAISVEVFTSEEAESYIRTVLGDEKLQKKLDTQKSLQDLIEITGRLPLALSLICAYLKNNQDMSIRNYINRYETEKSNPLPQNDIESKISAIWAITMKKMEEELPASVELMYFCVFLHNENIPDYLLKSLFTEETNFLKEMTIDKAKRTASEYSMITMNNEKKLISLHCLIQKTIKIQLAQNKTFDHLRKSIVALTKIYDNYFCNDTFESINLKKELLPHLETILKNYDEFLTPLSLLEDDKRLGDIFFYLNDTYSNLGNAHKQKEFSERALFINEKCYGEKHVYVARAFRNLGIAHIALGDTKKAKEYLNKALCIYKENYGKEHYEVAITFINLSLTYGPLDNTYYKRIEFLERALFILEKYSGEEFIPIIAIIFANLGDAYQNFGETQKSKELLERSLFINMKLYGKEHIHVAKVLTNLGIAYGELGHGLSNNLDNTRKAKNFLEQALFINEEYYGKEHIETAGALTILGRIYCDLDNAKEGKKFLKRALFIAENYYGKEHPRLFYFLNNLSIVYCDLGEIQKSMRVSGRALCTIGKNKLGEDLLAKINYTYHQKINLEEDSSLISFLKEKTSLSFFGIRDENYKVDAVVEIATKEDKKAVKTLQKELNDYGRFFKFNNGRKGFVLEGINMPSENNEPSIGTKIQNYLRKQ